MTGAIAATSKASSADSPAATTETGQRYRPEMRFGLGGGAIGNGFSVTSDEDAEQALGAAWEGGVRFFDASPWYGLGLNERRFGHFLDDQKRGDFVISTKIGRLLVQDRDFRHGMLEGRSRIQLPL